MKKQSSTSVSVEDVPLKQRVKAKTQNVKKTKKESRKNTVPVQPNSKKFVIPRNKKTRELLDIQGLDSRDAVELLRKIKQSFYQPDIISNYVFESVAIVHNATFNTEFSVRKQKMRQDGYAQKDLEDTYAYLYLDNWHKVRKMAKEGLCVGSSKSSALGDPKMGVYVSRFPDVALPYAVPARTSKYLMVFKIAKGKLKAVSERSGDGCLLEPTPNYDGHISKSFPPAHNVSLEQAFTSSQYYFYEFSDDGDDLHEKRPRQCCPYAAIQFSVTSSQSHNVSSRNILTQDTSRNLPSLESRNVSSQLLSRKEKNNNDLVPWMGVKSMVDGRMYTNYSKHGRTLWSGVIKNKENILSSGDLICYSSDILPITIGGHIDIKGKVSYEKLKPFLPIFKQLPAISTKCKVFKKEAMYLYCEIRPRDKNNAKLAKLIQFFQKRNLAGVAEFPDSSADIYVVPTSDFSHQLGLTDRHYPNMLHAIIRKRLPKEDIQSYKKMNKMTADPAAEAAVRRDIRKELSRIQMEKLKKREPSQLESSSRVSSDMEMSSSDDKAGSDVEKKKSDGKNKVVGTDKAASKEKSTTVAKIRPDESESSSKCTNDSTKTTQNDGQLPAKTCLETNVLSALGETVYGASTSEGSDEELKDVEKSPNKENQEIVVDVDEVFKSPPAVQNQAKVVDDTFSNDVPRTNTITRHFIDPRLSWKGGRFLPASPTEIEPLSSDSGADTPEASPVLRYLKTTTVGTPHGSVVTPLGGVDCIGSARIKTKKASGDKDNVSRLSSRLMALFSGTGKRPIKSSAGVDSTISIVTSTASTATVTKSTVTELSSLSSEPTHATEDSPPTSIPDKPQRASLPLSIPSSTSFSSSNFPSAGDSVVSSECVATVPEDDKPSMTYSSSTPSQTSLVTLESSRVYPYTNTIHDNSPATLARESSELSSEVCSMSSLQTAVPSSTFMSSLSATAINLDSSLGNRSPESMVVTYSSAEASPNVVSIAATASSAFTATECITPSPVQAATERSYLSETIACSATNTSARTASNISEEPEMVPKSEQSPQFTANTYLNEIISFFHAKTTASATTAAGTFLVSPSTSSSTSTMTVPDEGHTNDISKAESTYSYEPQVTLNSTDTSLRCDFFQENNAQELPEPIQNSVGTDWYSTVDTYSSVAVPVCSTSSQIAVTGTLYETFSSNNAPAYATVTGTSCETYNSNDVPRQIPVTETCETYSSNTVPAETPTTVTLAGTYSGDAVPTQIPAAGASCYSSGSVSVTCAADSPPLPTEPLPPPPPPPLTLSLSSGYTTTYTNIRNKGGLSNLTITSAQRGADTYPDGQFTSVAQPISQENTDLYEYGLTLSSDQATTQGDSDLYFDEGNVHSTDSSRSSTPVITPMEKHLKPGLLPQYPLESILPPPPPPPPPLPPLASVYNPPVFHQDNYSTTYSPFNTYPYSGIQPIPNPTLSEFYCTAPGNTGYSNVLSSLTKDFDSTSKFGYTKQITPLWENSSCVIGDEEQPLATKHSNQHKHSKHVDDLSSRNTVDITSLSKQDESSSWKLGSEVGETALSNSASGQVEIHEETIRTPESLNDVDENLRTTEDTASSYTPATEDEHALKETEVITNTTAPGEQGEYSNSKKIAERKSDEPCTPEGSGKSPCTKCEDSALDISAVSHVDGARQDNIRNLTIKEQGKQAPSLSNDSVPGIQQDSIKENISSNNSGKLSEAITADSKEIVDSLQEKRDGVSTKDKTVDKISSLLDIRLSNISEFLDSNDETYVEIPLSEKEIPPGKTVEKSKRTKAKKGANQKTASTSSSEGQTEHCMFEYVDSNDETFVEIPLSQKDVDWKRNLNQDGIDEYSDGEVNNAGRKRERITDLRELIRDKKRKLANADSEMPTTPRNRRRVVEIVGREAAVTDDSTLNRSEVVDEMLRDLTSPVSEGELVISDNFKVALENRRKMRSPDSGSGYSTPDHTRTLDDARWKISSSDKRRRSASPESKSRERSPEYDRGEHYKSYNRRPTGSNENSRAGGIAGSRPGSSASSRQESNASSRPGSSASLRTGSSLSLPNESNTKRYSPRKRSRVEKETQDETRESERKQARYRSDRVLDVDYPSRLSDRGLDEDYPAKHLSSRGLDEHYRTKLSDRDMDESYSKMSPAVDSRRERQRSISPTEKRHYSSYASERDNPAPRFRLSPSRESRYRSRYSIKRHDARSSSSDSGSYRTRHNNRNNNNWSKHDKRPDVLQTARNQIDFSDKSFLSRVTRPDIIERMQNFVYDEVQRTLEQYPECLDAPVEKDEKEKQKPFFGGIGEYIYAKRDEEDSLYEESQGYRSVSDISRRTGTSGDYHGEGDSAVVEKGSTISQSPGFKARQNVTQKDNNNNFVNMKQAKALYKCTEGENQDTSEVLSQEFIAQFKQKRRRVLLDQLRSLRGKEKIGSCAIILTKLEKLKRDVRILSAAKLRICRAGKNTNGKERKDNKNRNNDIQCTQDQHDQVDNTEDYPNVKDVRSDVTNNLNPKRGMVDSTNKETIAKAVPYPALHKPPDSSVDSCDMRDAAGDGTDYNVTSVRSSNSDGLGLDDRLKGRDETQLASNDQTQMHKSIPSAFNQESMKQGERLKSNSADVERNCTGKSNNISRSVPVQVSTDVHPLMSASGTGERIGGPTSKDQDESSLARSRNEEHEESAEVKQCANIESTTCSIRNINTPEQFDEFRRPECTDQRADGRNSLVDFEWIAHMAKCEFKFQLMIKSQELFPKHNLMACATGNNSRKNKGRKRDANGLHTQNNPTAGSNSGHDLPVNQPSQHQNRRSLEEKDIEKKLSSVLSSLTKSQLDILQNGSPSRRSECDPKFVDSANI